MGGLVGAGGPIAVEVTAREPGRMLAWRAAAAGPGRADRDRARRERLRDRRRITAEHDRARTRTQAFAALEALLDELGSPERRPFAPA